MIEDSPDVCFWPNLLLLQEKGTCYGGVPSTREKEPEATQV